MKIISYSLWGNDDRYLLPLLDNLLIAKQLFSEWQTIVYVSKSLPQDFKDKILSHNALIYECDESPDSRGMFWRYRAILIDKAEIVIFRDADSVLTQRDQAMVKHWETSNKDFCVCRDHPSHTKPVTGGLWGVKGNGIKKIQHIARFNPKYAVHGDDEKYLAQTVYLKHRKDFMVFAPYLLYRGEINEPIQLKRENAKDYLGRVHLHQEDSGDKIMQELWDKDNIQPQKRWLIPYTLSWKIAHWIAAKILKKNVQHWRDFEKETLQSKF